MSGNLNQILGEGIKSLEKGGGKVPCAVVVVPLNSVDEESILGKINEEVKSFNYRAYKILRRDGAPIIYHIHIKPIC